MTPTAPDGPQSSARTRLQPTGSDLVVAAIIRLGGQPSRREVLDVVAATRGVREATLAIKTAELGQRCKRVLREDGRVALELTEAER